MAFPPHGGCGRARPPRVSDLNGAYHEYSGLQLERFNNSVPVHIWAGQCGEQIGAKLWELTLDEHGNDSDDDRPRWIYEAVPDPSTMLDSDIWRCRQRAEPAKWIGYTGCCSFS